MTDGLRIAHPQDCPLEGNPEVGNPEGNQFFKTAVLTMGIDIFKMTMVKHYS